MRTYHLYRNGSPSPYTLAPANAAVWPGRPIMPASEMVQPESGIPVGLPLHPIVETDYQTTADHRRI